MPQISVIVPVYNCYQYLDQCIDSILKQTYQDFEIILVNDGSSDLSAVLCDSYVNHPKIHVYHKTNGGASSARNLGIEKSIGRYLMFVDGDDLIRPRMLEDLMHVILSTNADVVGSRLERFPKTIKKSHTNLIQNFDGTEILIQFFTGRIDHSPCTKLFKRTTIGTTRFIEGITNEDFIFLYEVYCKTNHIAYLDSAYYLYRDNPNSVTHRFGEHYYNLYSNMLYVERMLLNVTQQVQEAFRIYKCKVCLDTAFYTLKHKCKSTHIEIYSSCRKYSLNSFMFILFSKKISYRYKLKFVLLLLSK